MADLFAEKYSLLALLGQGGMCEVYRARQLLFDRQVAIKILRRSLALSPESRQRFLREARNCARLDHPAIITIYDVDEWEERPYIAMQYIDGGSLEGLIDKGLNALRGIEIMADVANALACAHEIEVAHRDLKPDNILIASDGRVKVADWGLAKCLDGAQDLTHAGVVLGTPEYMSPEQIMSKPLSMKSDLYSLGVLLYEVLTGCLPFQTETMTDLLQAHIYNEPTPIKTYAPFIPQPLDNLVTELLAKEPDERPQSAKHVAVILEKVATEFGTGLNEHEVKRKRAAGATPTSPNVGTERTSGEVRSSKRSTKKNLQELAASGRPTVRIFSKKARLLMLLFIILVIALLVYWRSQ